jgi:hypothetical protein
MLQVTTQPQAAEQTSYAFSLSTGMHSDYYEENLSEVFRNQVQALINDMDRFDARMWNALEQSTDEQYRNRIAELRFELHEFKQRKLAPLKFRTYGPY